MLTSATAMLFGAREWFFQTASRRALSRMARCRGPTLAGAGPRALATFLRARSRLARSPLDPRSIPARSPLDPRSARLARSVTHSLSQSRSRSESRSLGRGRSVARHSARSLSVGRAVGRAGGRSPGSPGSHVVARLRCKGSAASRVSTHVHCAHAQGQGTGGRTGRAHLQPRRAWMPVMMRPRARRCGVARTASRAAPPRDAGAGMPSCTPAAQAPCAGEARTAVPHMQS